MRLNRRFLISFALLSFALRAIVPLGFMPASISDGKFVEICPSGMPAELVAALFGEHHLHHGSSAASADFSHCDLGGSFGGLAAIDTSADVLPIVDLAKGWSLRDAKQAPRRVFERPRARSPPDQRLV